MEYKLAEGGREGMWQKAQRWGAESSNIIKSINEFLAVTFKCVDRKGD